MTGAAGPRVAERDGWATYVAAYHDAHPGITEDLLAAARDDAGRSPYEWLLEVVPPRGTVVDLACGSAPVARGLRGARVIGLDRSGGELARARASAGVALVRADAGALPLAPATADAVTVSMALMVLAPLAVVLTEAGRVLRPGGRLVATVPTRAPSPGDQGSTALFTEILVRLGQARIPYPAALDPASAPRELGAAGFQVVEDTTALFVRPLVGEADAELVVRSFYAPGASAAQISAAVDALRERARRDRVELGYRLRRLVAVAAGPPGPRTALR